MAKQVWVEGMDGSNRHIEKIIGKPWRTCTSMGDIIYHMGDQSFPVINRNMVNWVNPKDFKNYGNRYDKWIGTWTRDKKNIPQIIIKGLFEAGVLKFTITKVSSSPSKSVSNKYKYRANKRKNHQRVGKHQVVVMITTSTTAIVPIHHARDFYNVMNEGVWKFLHHIQLKDLELLEWK